MGACGDARGHGVYTARDFHLGFARRVFTALRRAVRKRRADRRGIRKMVGVEDPLVVRGFDYTWIPFAVLCFGYDIYGLLD